MSQKLTNVVVVNEIAPNMTSAEEHLKKVVRRKTCLSAYAAPFPGSEQVAVVIVYTKNSTHATQAAHKTNARMVE